jgi:hypothetical protein
MIMINPFSKIKAAAAYLKTITRIYQNRIKIQDKLLETSAKWISGYEAAIQNSQILISDYSAPEGKYTGNEYKDYDTATKEIENRYTCKADWGTAFTGPIVDIRSALISGDRINVKVKENARPGDSEWLDEFLDLSGLNDYQLMEMVTSTQIEGRLLWKLEYDPEHEWKMKENGTRTGMVRAIPILWLEDKYEVKTDKYKQPETIEFSDEGQKDLNKDEFVYRKFGGIMNKVNDPVQKVWRTLAYVEAAEKCLRDLREINHLYASPRPVFKCKDLDEVKKVLEQLRLNPNWKTNAPFITTAEFSYVQPDLTHVMALVKEFYTNIQVVSTITGIPVHWLALVDLMSNRSTADDLGDITELAVSTERQIITSALRELVKKAAAMQYDKAKLTQVDHTVFDISLSIITDEQWRHLKEIYLPAAEKKLLPVKQLLDKMPNIDAEAALEELTEQNKSDAAFTFQEPGGGHDEDLEEDE